MLGFPVLGQLSFNDARGFTITYVQASTSVLEFFSFSSPTIQYRWNPGETILGLKHLGFEVDDVDSVAAQLKDAGVAFIYSPFVDLA